MFGFLSVFGDEVVGNNSISYLIDIYARNFRNGVSVNSLKKYTTSLFLVFDWASYISLKQFIKRSIHNVKIRFRQKIREFFHLNIVLSKLMYLHVGSNFSCVKTPNVVRKIQKKDTSC